MQQYSSQKLEMQIPQESSYNGLTTMPNHDEKLIKFLKEHFKFPSDNLNEITEFISEDSELKKIINVSIILSDFVVPIILVEEIFFLFR